MVHRPRNVNANYVTRYSKVGQTVAASKVWCISYGKDVITCNYTSVVRLKLDVAVRMFTV
jgi:hypothetical protein